MTISQPTPAGAVLVAIDIAKHRHEVLLELPGRQRRRRLTVLNTRSEHDRLVACLQGFEAPIVVGFEATGNYHRPLAHRLLGEGFELRLISSVALARTREALSNGWDKNDPKDAQVMLHMLRISLSQPTDDLLRRISLPCHLDPPSASHHTHQTGCARGEQVTGIRT